MSVKKKTPSFCKLPSCLTKKYDGIFWTKRTGIVIFTTISLTFSIPSIEEHDLLETATKGLIRVLQFEAQQRYILQKEMTLSNRELGSSVDSLRDVLKIFDQVPIVYRFHYQSPKLKLDLQS